MGLGIQDFDYVGGHGWDFSNSMDIFYMILSYLLAFCSSITLQELGSIAKYKYFYEWWARRNCCLRNKLVIVWTNHVMNTLSKKNNLPFVNCSCVAAIVSPQNTTNAAWGSVQLAPQPELKETHNNTVILKILHAIFLVKFRAVGRPSIHHMGLIIYLNDVQSGRGGFPGSCSKGCECPSLYSLLLHACTQVLTGIPGITEAADGLCSVPSSIKQNF